MTQARCGFKVDAGTAGPASPAFAKRRRRHAFNDGQGEYRISGADESEGLAMKRAITAFLLLAAMPTFGLAAERPMRFWNLTRHAITEFYLNSPVFFLRSQALP